jgi:DNA-binding NarL/FixJ family response regulator
MTIRLVLADDHPLILDSLAYIFSQEHDIEVLAYCRDGVSAIHEVRQHKPDIALLDVHMPGMSGLEVARVIREEKLPTRIVLFAAEIDADEMIKAGKLGVEGVMLKDEAHQLLTKCIRTVHAGEFWLEQRTTMCAMEKLMRREESAKEIGALLSRRETEVVRMVALGLQNNEIADKLFISEGTLMVHLNKIYKKLNLTGGRIALLRYLQEKGLT